MDREKKGERGECEKVERGSRAEEGEKRRRRKGEGWSWRGNKRKENKRR